MFQAIKEQEWGFCTSYLKTGEDEDPSVVFFRVLCFCSGWPSSVEYPAGIKFHEAYSVYILSQRHAWHRRALQNHPFCSQVQPVWLYSPAAIGLSEIPEVSDEWVHPNTLVVMLSWSYESKFQKCHCNWTEIKLAGHGEFKRTGWILPCAFWRGWILNLFNMNADRRSHCKPLLSLLSYAICLPLCKQLIKCVLCSSFCRAPSSFLHSSPLCLWFPLDQMFSTYLYNWQFGLFLFSLPLHPILIFLLSKQIFIATILIKVMPACLSPPPPPPSTMNVDLNRKMGDERLDERNQVESVNSELLRQMQEYFHH